MINRVVSGVVVDELKLIERLGKEALRAMDECSAWDADPSELTDLIRTLFSVNIDPTMKYEETLFGRLLRSASPTEVGDFKDFLGPGWMESETGKIVEEWRRDLRENKALWFTPEFRLEARKNPYSPVHRAFIILLDAGEIKQVESSPNIWAAAC